MMFKDLKDLNLKEQYLQKISTEQNVIFLRNQFLRKKGCKLGWWTTKTTSEQNLQSPFFNKNDNFKGIKKI